MEVNSTLSSASVLDRDTPNDAPTLSAQDPLKGAYSQSAAASLEQDLDEETQDLPKFHLNEIVQGPWLGRGGFCDVFEISAMRLSKETEVDATSDTVSETIQSIRNETKVSQEWRKFLSLHCLREYGSEDARFAIKRIRPDIRKDPVELGKAIADLNIEISILNRLEHPHIIKVRGLGAGPRFHADAFVIVDRLYDSLGGRMKRWREEKDSYKGLIGKWQDPLQTKRGRLWRKRLLVALDLSSALSFLHSKRIIHRDIKPQNIGFDVRDDVKLFDFGLARKLPSAKESINGDLFNLSVCGSLRYMAPEVFCRKPYGETCDVYSFAILCWEVLSLKEAFRKYDSDDLMLQHVHSTPYRRPRVKRSWPSPLKDILQQAWHPVALHRPHMREVEDVLGQLLHGNGDDKKATAVQKRLRRRSSHVLHCDTSVTSIDEVHGCW